MLDYPFTTEYLPPVRVVAAEGKTEGIEELLKEKPLQIGLAERGLFTVSGKASIILDFGKEYSGGVRILTHITKTPSVSVRLRFGESVAETCAELGERGACNDHSNRDFVVNLSCYSDMTFGQTGFRFLRIDFEKDAYITIKSVLCAYTHRIFPAAERFVTSDAEIQNIYATAKRTIELCCQTYVWDGIKRDRLVWIGDMHPEMLALTSLYGRMKIIEDSLDFSVSGFPVGEWMNNMPMYSAWLLIIMADYCEITGADDYVARHRAYIEGLLEQIDGCIKDDGTLDFPSYFVDWPTHEQPDELAGCRAILKIMARKMTGLCEKIGISGLYPIKMLKKLSLVPIEVKHAKQVVALKFFAEGGLGREDRELLVKGGAAGMSTFMGYYILKAIAETTSVETAVSVMKEYYGAMLKKGATTFFEDFDMAWAENSSDIDRLPKEGERDIHGDFGKYCYVGFRHSFCHGWSAGVLRFLYDYCNEA